MRVGILSLLLNTNYGGILQAYALQNVLERLGHEVKVIDHEAIPDLPVWRKVIILPKALLQKYILRTKKRLWPAIHYKHLQYKRRSANTRNFIFRNIHLRKCKALKRLGKREFDAIVVGSDQVWRPTYFCCWGNKLDAFLLFAKDWKIKRISYAASFGVDQWEFSESETRKARMLAQLFNAISVRETEGVKLCKEFLGIDAIQVLDPTLLLSRKDYEQHFSHIDRDIVQGELLNYILDDAPEKSELIGRIAMEKQLRPFRVNVSESTVSDTPRQPVEIWLKAFHDAQFVVTDSFHACVFAIIFKKPFICLCNKERGGSRFQTLRETLDLKNNFIERIEDYDGGLDYIPSEESYRKLELLREKSLNFLREHLSRA